MYNIHSTLSLNSKKHVKSSAIDEREARNGNKLSTKPD
jgi:hypothetical protein